MHIPAEFDVLVAGGGPAGAATALALARNGHRVLLAERGGAADFTIGEALPPATRTVLRDLGIWEDFRAQGHLPCYGTRLVWGSALPHETDFVFDPNGHGWHLDRPGFDRFLRARATAAGAQVHEHTAVGRCVRDERGWSVELCGPGSRFPARCRWLVDATGRSAGPARAAGARRYLADGLLCLFTRWRTAAQCPRADRDTRTLVEAAPDGWWYTALLPSGERVVAYLTDPDLLDPGVRTGPGFAARLRDAAVVDGQLGAHGYRMLTAPRAAPARSAWLHVPVGDRWLAVGDAALSCDPISAQGLLTALVGGVTAAAALSSALRTGEQAALLEYRSWLDRVRANYVVNLRSCYERERRWPDRPFWARRLVPAPADATRRG